VTDARGVVKTFSYNNRHLVTGITYNIANIPPTYIMVMPTANATFAYDAAGNRLSMADGTGSINYHYNNLSQLESETRQFTGSLAGVNYTLNYQYNLTVREATQELADDRAGRQLGYILTDLRAGKLKGSDAQTQIFNLLCDH